MLPKDILRQQARGTLKAMSAEARAFESHRICERLRQQPGFQSAHSIFFFAPLPSEPDIWPLFRDAIAAGKILAMPKFDSATGTYIPVQASEASLVPGPFGALEPSAGSVIKRLDFLLVPGLAFDPQGRRLGRGKGFYDRILSETPGVRCGIAFDRQILPEIPAEPHDASVDFIVTPSRWLDCRGQTPAT